MASIGKLFKKFLKIRVEKPLSLCYHFAPLTSVGGVGGRDGKRKFSCLGIHKQLFKFHLSDTLIEFFWKIDLRYFQHEA